MKSKKFFALIIVAVLLSTISVFSCAEGEAGALYDINGTLLSEEDVYFYREATAVVGEYIHSGQNVKLSIDLPIQKRTQELLNEYPDGCAVVLDANNGAPLALAAVGDADPLMSTYSPDQLFMPCTALAALNLGIIDIQDTIACEGVFTRYEQDGIAPECWIWNSSEDQHLTHAEECVESALADQCQYFFYCLGNDLGIDDIESYARSLGLGKASGIEFEESTGVMASRELKTMENPWRIGDTLDAAVGRGYSSFTALQLARYCAAIAGSGKAYSASILAEVSDPNGEVIYQREREIISQAPEMEEYKWLTVRNGMYMSMYDPAQLTSGEYDGEQAMVGFCGEPREGESGEYLFMGFAPWYKPEIAMAIILHDAPDTDTVRQLAWEIWRTYKQLR